MPNNLKKKSIHGLLWELLGNFSQQGISFVISIILARLLSPEDFGLVGMSMVVIAIFRVFTDFGFAAALVQNPNNTSLTYSTTFYFNVAIGLCLFLCMQVAAPFIGKFYDSSEVVNIFRLLSVGFIFGSLNIVQGTILQKAINFKLLTVRSIIAQVLGGIIGVGMAFNGYGVYSLVGQTISSGLITTIFLWNVTKWYPKLEFSWAELKKLSNFSIFMFFDRLTSTISQRFDILFIGKVFSPTTLGYYSRAESLNSLVVKNSSKSFTKVFFPVLSQLKDNHSKFIEVFIQVSSVISFLAFLLTGIFYVLGGDLIIILFGQKWEPSVWIFKLLILKAFAYPVNSMVVNAFFGKGYAKQNFYIGLFRKSFRLLPIAFGLWLGMEGFIYALVAVSYIMTVVNGIFLSSIIKVPFIPYMKGLFHCALPLVLLIIFSKGIMDTNLMIRMLIASIFVLVYFTYLLIIKHKGIYFLIEQLNQYRNKRVFQNSR